MFGMNVPCLEAPRVPERRVILNKTPLYYTQSQLQALVDLHYYAEVFTRSSGVSCGGIKPRTKCLLLGGTGSGKTHVARSFAQSRKWSFTSVDSSAWIPEGSSKTSTLRLLRDYIRKQPVGVIMLDEIDKLVPSGSAAIQQHWSISCWGEAICILDQDERLLSHEWTRDDISKLQSFFFVAAGAFEFYLREAKRKARGCRLGFGTDENKPENFAAFLSNAGALPDEIATRFAPPIFIGSPSREDYAKAIEEIHNNLGVTLTRPIEALVEEAEASQGGMRWCETYLTGLLREHPEASQKSKSKEQGGEEKIQGKEKAETFDFFSTDTVEHVRQLNGDIFSLNSVLAKITSTLSIAIECGKVPEKLWPYLNAGVPFLDHTDSVISSCGICAEISSDPGYQVLYEWLMRVWEGIRSHSLDLQNCGLLPLWLEAYDLSNRVCQRRLHLGASIARGRYKV